MTILQALGTAVPPHAYAQMDLLEFMLGKLPLEPPQQDQLRKLYAHSGINTRHSVLADFGQQPEAGGPALFGAAQSPSLQQRMAVFHAQALPLALQAIQRSEADLSQVTHLIAVTCTGLAAPGLDLMLMRALDLPSKLMRSSVNFMGCYAALHGLKQADAICKADPKARVLLVCVELCTLHFQFETSWDSLTSSLLFADGAAAALLTGQQAADQPGLGLELLGFASEVAFEGWEEMAWHPAETGFLMRLGPGVPAYLRQGARPLVERALAAHQLTPADVSHWCLHPGGRKIIDEFAAALSLAPEAVQASRKVLERFGNMSSPTVLFVLRELLPAMQTGERGLMAAFGPGLTLESAVFQRL